MILRCSFEELRALESGANLTLTSGHDRSGGRTSDALAAVERLLPQLEEGISVANLSELRDLRSAVDLIAETLHARWEDRVVEFHPAHEEAVNLHFDYAHAVVVRSRLDAMAAEMATMIELMTGAEPTAQTAASVDFPD